MRRDFDNDNSLPNFFNNFRGTPTVVAPRKVNRRGHSLNLLYDSAAQTQQEPLPSTSGTQQQPLPFTSGMESTPGTQYHEIIAKKRLRKELIEKHMVSLSFIGSRVL